jgi:hypothetical protein
MADRDKIALVMTAHELQHRGNVLSRADLDQVANGFMKGSKYRVVRTLSEDVRQVSDSTVRRWPGDSLTPVQA